MTINVVSEYRRPRGARAADRVSVKAGGLFYLLCAVVLAGYAAWGVWVFVVDHRTEGLAPAAAAEFAGVALVAGFIGVRLLTRGLSRTAALVLGLTYAVSSVIAGLLAVLFVFLWVRFEGAELLAAAGVAMFVFLGCAWFSRRLIRGNRHLCLFLRRFGFTEVTSRVSRVAEGRAGISWRVVTLDDLSVAPVGAARRARYLVLLAGFLPVAVGVGAWVHGIAHVDGESGAHAAMAWGLAAGAFLLVLIVPAAISARRARRHARVEVNRDEAVPVVVRKIRKRNRRVLSPRMVVCRVADPQWRSMVLAMSGSSDAVIVDVSMPSPSVVWEVASLLNSGADHCVFVCHAEMVDQLSAAPPWDHSPTGQLAVLLHDHDVLVYGSDPHELKVFARSLRNRLDTAALTRPRR